MKTIKITFFTNRGAPYELDVELDAPAIRAPWRGSASYGAPCVGADHVWDEPRQISELIEQGETDFYVSDLDAVSPVFWYGKLKK